MVDYSFLYCTEEDDDDAIIRRIRETATPSMKPYIKNLPRILKKTRSPPVRVQICPLDATAGGSRKLPPLARVTMSPNYVSPCLVIHALDGKKTVVARDDIPTADAHLGFMTGHILRRTEPYIKWTRPYAFTLVSNVVAKHEDGSSRTLRGAFDVDAGELADGLSRELDPLFAKDVVQHIRDAATHFNAKGRLIPPNCRFFHVDVGGGMRLPELRSLRPLRKREELWALYTVKK